jgi:hypothetical protein
MSELVGTIVEIDGSYYRVDQLILTLSCFQTKQENYLTA